MEENGLKSADERLRGSFQVPLAGTSSRPSLSWKVTNQRWPKTRAGDARRRLRPTLSTPARRLRHDDANTEDGVTLRRSRDDPDQRGTFSNGGDPERWPKAPPPEALAWLLTDTSSQDGNGKSGVSLYTRKIQMKQTRKLNPTKTTKDEEASDGSRVAPRFSRISQRSSRPEGKEQRRM